MAVAVKPCTKNPSGPVIVLRESPAGSISMVAEVFAQLIELLTVALMVGPAKSPTTVTVAVLLQPAASVPVTVYVSVLPTVGFCWVELKLLGPIQLQLLIVPVVASALIMVLKEAQVSVPPVAVKVGPPAPVKMNWAIAPVALFA